MKTWHAAPQSTVNNMLLFYCRECETTFESEPDGTGYEQAPCPACRDICMTVQFEQEEQDRHRNEAALFSMILRLPAMPWIDPYKFFDSDSPAEHEEQNDLPPMRDPVTVGTFGNLDEANTCCSLLEHLDIQPRLVQVAGTNPFLPNASDGMVLQVRSDHAERAKEILDTYQSVKDKNRAARDQDGPIEFACEECESEITFPAERRGLVEVCPRCGQYIDVPE